MLLDQNVDYYDGVWVDFFGRPACTSKAMATIAHENRRAGAAGVQLSRRGWFPNAIVGEILPPANHR
jgi:lauroyl/myristoyl acyltransferase